MSDILSWIWLSTRLPVASPYADLLMERFCHSADAIYKAEREDYEKISELKSEYIDLLSDKSLEEAKKILDWCTQNNVGLLPYDSKFYPQRLRDIEKAPLLLYYRGKLINFDDNVCIALVGTRRMTSYGKREAYKISRDLILGGAVVVSGMARGIDTVSHRGALDAGGYTVAVLGCGIDKVYPAENEYIMEEIARNGLVLTEYKPFTPPYGGNFPTRNRIISGLSLGTLVVEADAKSGAMITAKCAEKQGRDIFSMPGNVGELNSVGPNRLLKKGAKIVTGALDMLEEYEYLYPHRIRIENLPAFIPKFQSSQAPEPTVRPAKKRCTSSASEPSETGSKQRTASKKTTEARADALAESVSHSTPKAERDLSALNDMEKQIYALFPEGSSVSADELSRSGVPVGTVLQNLTMLEIKGFIKAAPGGVYVKL